MVLKPVFSSKLAGKITMFFSAKIGKINLGNVHVYFANFLYLHAKNSNKTIRLLLNKKLFELVNEVNRVNRKYFIFFITISFEFHFTLQVNEYCANR